MKTSKILSYMCGHGLCAYTKKHKCKRRTNLDVFIREHDIDEKDLGDFDFENIFKEE